MLAGLWKPDKGCARAFGLVAKRAVEEVENWPSALFNAVEGFDGRLGRGRKRFGKVVAVFEKAGIEFLTAKVRDYGCGRGGRKP
jgi:hypothetical protein